MPKNLGVLLHLDWIVQTSSVKKQTIFSFVYQNWWFCTPVIIDTLDVAPDFLIYSNKVILAAGKSNRGNCLKYQDVTDGHLEKTYFNTLCRKATISKIPEDST